MHGARHSSAIDCPSILTSLASWAGQRGSGDRGGKSAEGKSAEGASNQPIKSANRGNRGVAVAVCRLLPKVIDRFMCGCVGKPKQRQRKRRNYCGRNARAFSKSSMGAQCTHSLTHSLTRYTTTKRWNIVGGWLLAGWLVVRFQLHNCNLFSSKLCELLYGSRRPDFLFTFTSGWLYFVAQAV